MAHTHTFEDAGTDTRISDRVEYELPFGPLGTLVDRLFVARQVESIFAYRQKVVAALFEQGTSIK